MNIRMLGQGDQDILSDFLADYPNTCMFIRSNLKISGLEFANKPFHGEYLGSFDNLGKINGVLVHYWNGNLIMQAKNVEVLQRLIIALQKMISRSIAGVLGDTVQANLVIDHLNLSGDLFAIKRSEGLYAVDLEKLVLPAKHDIANYQMIPVNKLTDDILFQWLKDYHIEALGAQNNKSLDRQIKAEVKNRKQDLDCWALLAKSKPVSLCGFNARLPDVVQLGPVWTPPELRNNGFARILVILALLKAKDENVKRAILFTENPAAIKAYSAIGFKRVGDFCMALLKEPITIA